MTTIHIPSVRMMSDPEAQLRLLFQRVPYGVEVVWVDHGEEVYKVLKPLSKLKGDWVWGGEAKGSTDPTWQYGTFRMWSSGKGKQMLATKQPDIEKLRKWVTKIVNQE